MTDVPFTPVSFVNRNSWQNDLWLLTPAELEVTPKGTKVTSIFFDEKTVGEDYIDTDTRFGYTAYGLFPHQFKTES